ncbi:MAG: hypothetical protein JWN52_7990 [Actinomycetia bacterium]|nr:hypothetical protein [Actinomycetes bacterium]
MPRTTAHIGDRALTGQRDETLEQRTVQRLAVKFISELGVVAPGDCVVGSPHPGGHAALARRLR